MPSIIVHGGAGDYDPDEIQERGVTSAVSAGWEILEAGGSALDAVVAAIVVMEDDPIFRAGLGSALNFEGAVETDASIMQGDLSCGAVAALTAAANPIKVARLVMERTDHVMLAGRGADEFARRMGVEGGDLRTEQQLALHAKLRAQFAGGEDLKFMPKLHALAGDIELGTVGAAAVDADGRIAAGTSTGGMMMKLPGRVGDSAVIGAGTYAGEFGGASATGHGEPIIRHVFSKVTVDAVGSVGVREAVDMAIEIGRGHDVKFGIIGVEENGAVAQCFSTRAMAWASMRDGTLETFLNGAESRQQETR
ncbi:MAG: isoaspartyl peptidase/L-asparaginase [Candidatus Eisenbacteria bacterium]